MKTTPSFELFFAHRVPLLVVLVAALAFNVLYPYHGSVTWATGRPAYGAHPASGAGEGSTSLASIRDIPATVPTAHIVPRPLPRNDIRILTITSLPLAALAGTSNWDREQDYRPSGREAWALLPTLSPHELERMPEVEAPTPPPTPTPLPTETPVPVPAPSRQALVLGADGPRGCPLQPSAGRVVMTQGYGVGSHNPAEVWGAVDLAVNTGVWEGVPVVATHDGVAWVGWEEDFEYGGNQVTLTEGGTGWRTNYAHLSEILVQNGQYVTAGTVLGMMGSTGKTTGPHLDYQVWSGSTNVDPTGLVEPCFAR